MHLSWLPNAWSSGKILLINSIADNIIKKVINKRNSNIIIIHLELVKLLLMLKLKHLKSFQTYKMKVFRNK